MDRNHVLGMVCGYYLSRFDKVAYARLGYLSQQATHQALGSALAVPAESIKNWRDEFDPVHENDRQGWHRREMYPTRRRTIEALGDLAEEDLFQLVRMITGSPSCISADDLVAGIGDAHEGGVEDGGGAYGLRGPTGRAAERAFVDYHAQTGKPLPGRLVDCTRDQCGYDFEIGTLPEGVVVEVKGLAGNTGGITFTAKEWSVARELGDQYCVVVVRNVATSAQISIIRNPAAYLVAQIRTYTTVQVGWSVSHRAIRIAEADVSM